MTAGKWRLSKITPVIVISSGLVYTDVTGPKGLSIFDIFHMVEEHPHTGYYDMRGR